MSGFRFLRNVLLVSIVGLIPPLALFVFLSPGFSTALSQGGPALLRFLRQVLTNGLPVVFAINYVGFFLYALSKQTERRGDPVSFVAIDVLARLSLFFCLHALIYVLSADWYGSFGATTEIAVILSWHQPWLDLLTSRMFLGSISMQPSSVRCLCT